MGARALFAFRRGAEALEHATREEFLGAVMEAEFQAYEVAFVKAHQSDPAPNYTPRRGRRRQR